MLADRQKQQVYHLCCDLQDRLTVLLEEVDGKGQAVSKRWQKTDGGGGGESRVIRGDVVEKAGINCSQVWGARYPRLDRDESDKPYYATGLSTICHMTNPHAPIGHMNIRLLEVGDKFWFGGGADLTPCIIYQEDRRDFHDHLRQVCDDHEVGDYQKFSQWCDEYFFIKHRNSPRGVGGIFFDYLEGDFEKLLSFVKEVASAYCDIYPKILRRRQHLMFSDAEREQLLYWRGRYVEFNLVYDRGTHFGLKTGGNIEAILVSLPPTVKW